MADIYIDLDVLTNLAETGVRSGGNLLDVTFRPDNLVKITSTVRGEASGNLDYLKDRILNTWIENGISAGLIENVPSSILPGTKNAGERSILEALLDSPYPAVVYSDDQGAQTLIFEGSEAPVRNSQDLLVDALFGGGISLNEYYSAATVLENNGVGERDLPYLDIGETIQSSNGHTITLNANGTLTIVDAFGRISVATLHDRIVFNPDGTVDNRGIPTGSTSIFEHCFLYDTKVKMWPLDASIKPRADGSYDEPFVLSKMWYKRQIDIQVGDLVVAYDERGRLTPSPVLRTMRNQSTHILDFWGTGVTPGHATYCGDGRFKGEHVPVLDILRSDGAYVNLDGQHFYRG